MPRAERSTNRRQEILEGLVRMLERETGSRITTAALAAEVGVSEAALYRHFPSKARMYEGVLDYVDEVLFSRIAVLRQSVDPVAASGQLLELLLQFVQLNPGIARLLCGDALLGEDPRLARRVAQMFERIETELRQLLRSAETERGQRTRLPAGQTAGLLMALFEGRMLQFVRSEFRQAPTADFSGHWQLLRESLFR